MSHRKLLAKLVIGSAVFAAMTPGHAAAPYPERPIRVVVTSSPGSGLDTVARTLSDDLGSALGQPVIVENKAGAAGIPGTREIVASAPNGYTLGLVSSNHAINPSLNKSLPYDSVKDLTAITLIGTVPLVLAVPAKSPYKSVQDLIKAARDKPSVLDYGSSGAGSALHLATLLLETKAGMKMTHIPYKGGSALVTDLISGQIDAAFLAIPTAHAQIKAGTIKALGVSAKDRLALLPDTPSLQEAGVKDYEYVPWIGLIGPAGLDKDKVALLQKKVSEVAALPKVKNAFDAQGFTPNVSTPEQFLDTIRRDIDLSATLIKQADIQPGS